MKNQKVSEEVDIMNTYVEISELKNTYLKENGQQMAYQHIRGNKSLNWNTEQQKLYWEKSYEESL